MGVDADAAGAGNLVLWASLFRYGWVFLWFYLGRVYQMVEFAGNRWLGRTWGFGGFDTIGSVRRSDMCGKRAASRNREGRSM